MKYNHLITTALFACLLTACNNQQQSLQNEIATPVSVTELKKGSISKLINTTGTAQSIFSAELTSLTSGIYKLQTNPATGKPFKLGDKVSKEQIVIRLEDQEYENSIAIHSKMLNLEISEQEQSKQKNLYDQNGVTLFDVRNSEVKVANARLDVENAKLNLEKMNIRAPFNGVIVDLPHYTSDVKIEQGKSVLSIMDYAQLYLDINLPESAIAYVRPEQPVSITHYTLPEDTLKGRISELSPAINTETRTFKGRILIQNTALKLRPGMFVKADIMVDRADSAIIISKDLIQSDRQKKYVYIVEKNTALIREIKTGLEDDKHVEILEGLNEKDNLIVKGFETLRENSPVKVQK
jgi:RND family efflux transporter MFP subunit